MRTSVMTARDAVPPDSVAQPGEGETTGDGVGAAEGVGLGISLGEGLGARLGDGDATVGVGDAVAVGPLDPHAARRTSATIAAIRMCP